MKRAEVNMAQEKSMAVSEFLGKAELLKQGAEARVYRVNFLGKPTIVKQRFPKRYRHPTLDEKLTHRRTTQEVRSILRCRKAGKCSSCCCSGRTRISDFSDLNVFQFHVWFFLFFFKAQHCWNYTFVVFLSLYFVTKCCWFSYICLVHEASQFQSLRPVLKWD